MRPTFAHGLRACCAAVVFAFAAQAAEPAPPPSPVGLNVDQVIARYGEPKSQIVAGNRVMMFFAREKFILRDGVVIEVERLPSEPPPRRAPPAPVVTAPPATAAPTDAAPAAATPPAAAVPVAVAPAPTAPTAATPTPGPAPAPSETTDPANAAPPEPKLAIKSVRPPSANYSPRPITKQAATRPQPPAAVPPTTAEAVTQTAVGSPPTTAAVPTPSAPTATSAMTASREAGATTPPATAAEDAAEAAKAEVAKAEVEAKAEAAALAAAAKAEKEKKFKIAKARRRLNEAGVEEPDISDAFLTTRTFVISFLVIAGGVAFLFWRSRQRQLALAATAVSRTPFAAPAVATSGGGAAFSADLLAKLEWKRFEELVAAYYVKTGVVAVRTKTGPSSPVHIKISWKGEPRPFACVQCLAHPQGLVDVKPLQELVAVLNTEDIRRGYVVTAGKFSVNARDLAEEKHLTLLPGDIFLEKLNALPDSARNEIMQTVNSGDTQTPSCPKCDAKMVRSTEDPATWQCTAHPDQVIPAWR